MANSDSEYPLHQPRRGSHHDPFDADTEADDDLKQERGAYRPRTPRYQTRGPLHQREISTTPQLPPHHMRDTLIIGVIAGIVVALQSIIITLINVPAYNEAKGKALSNVALGLVGLLCLNVFISLLIYFIAGFITGKIAVSRRLGFLAGFVAGAVAFVIDYLVHQIPQYPDTTTPGFHGGPGGILGAIVGALILVVIIGLVAGAISYLGARIATRRHVYYTRYEE